MFLRRAINTIIPVLSLILGSHCSYDYNNGEYFRPIIYLITKAHPYNDYSHGLNVLKGNIAFLKSKKCASQLLSSTGLFFFL